MGPQDFTIEDLLADANAAGATPEATAAGLLRWRTDLLDYGRSNKDPEDYWKGATRLDQDLAPVLENLRTQEGVRILRGLPAEQQSFFMAQYAKANGRPEDMTSEFQPVAQALNDLPDKDGFSLPTKPSVLTLYTDDGKPLADAIVRGGEALVRPLKEGGNPFLVSVPQRSKDELASLADKAEAEANSLRERAKGINLTASPLTDVVADKFLDDAKELDAREAMQRAEVYRSGDAVSLAALDIGQTIKGDPNLLSQVADKDLADRFQAGLLRASIGTARALEDLKDLTYNQGQGDGADKFKGFEEALQVTNEDTARSFRATDMEKASAAAMESAGQMAPTILPYGIATRAAGVAATEIGAALTMAPSSYGNELGQVLAQADELESLGDKDQARRMRSVARWSSLLQAGIDTGTEMMFPEVAGALRGGKGIVTRIATAPLKEGAEEVAAGIAERGVKQPLFYPLEQQQLLTEGATTEFTAGAMAAAPINVASEAIGYRQRRDAERAAVAASPDAGTARQVREIFDAAEDMAQLDLSEEGTAQGVGPETVLPSAGVPPPTPQTGDGALSPLTPPQESGAPLPATTLEAGPAPAVTPGIQDSGSDAAILEPVVETDTQAAPPPTITPPETTTASPNEEIQRQGEGQGQGLQVAPETIDPTMESAPPGGVNDPGVATPGTGTGSSAPALSATPVEVPVADTVSQVSTEVNTLPTVDIPHLQMLAGSNTVGESGLRLELSAYTPEERAFIARQMGVEDPSPAALAKAMRYQQQGPTRYSTGDSSIRGMTEVQARAALRTVPRNVTFINDAAAQTPWGRPWAGRANRETGQITLNLAFIKNAEDLRSRMNEEMLHLVWQDPQVRAAVATVEAAITPAMREEVARMGYDAASQTEEAATRMVDKITRTPDGRSAWRRLLDAIRNAFRRLFRMEPDGRQVEAAARELMRYAMSERPAPKGRGVAYSAAGDFEQVFGIINGDVKPLRSKADARSIAKEAFFDGALPVTSANTDRAFELAREWADPASGPDVVQRLLDAGYAAGQENVDLIPGTAQGEMFSYALKLAGTGDTSLLAFMDLTVNRWPVNGRNESLGTSEIAARLAARRDYSQSAMMDAVQKVNRQRQKKETTLIPGETMEAVTEAVTSTGLDVPAVRQVKRNVKDAKGKTLEEKVEEKVADNVAQSLLERFAKSQSDTLSWGEGKDGNPIIDKIRALVRRSLTLGPNAVMWDRVWLTNSLVDLGVTPELANALTATVAAERQRRANIQLLRQREHAAEMEKRRTAREAKQAAKQARKMAEANEKTAQDILAQLAELQSDTPTNRPRANPNAVRALVKQIMDPRVAMDGAVARPALEAELVKLGVDPVTAATVTRAAWQQRENNIAVLDEQARQRAQDAAQSLAEGEAGSLRGLEDAMLSVPVSATYSPVWRYNTAREYFSQLGLTPKQAEAAARLYSIEFGARLADAQANAIERISETDAPWLKKLKSLPAPARKKALSDMDKLRRAVRAGVTDPDTIWYNVVAREHGWRGFTPEQNIRMGQIDELLSDPNTDDYKKKALMVELQDIVARAGVPPTVADYVVSSYTMSALSGLPTIFVQLSAPFSIIRDFVSDIPSNPVVATRALITSMNSLVDEAVYAGKNDVYNHQVAEHLRESVPALRQLLENGLNNLQSTNPATKAKGMVQVIVGSQQYLGRLLNSMDQGAIAASEIYKTTMFTNRQLRRLGWTRDQAGLVILAALDARNDLMAEAMQRGLPRSEAAVWANEQFKKRIYSSLAEVDPDMAEDITKGAANEAVGMVGRLSDGINNTDEGLIRTPINYVLDAINRMHTKGGYTALAARLMFGFVNVPFRAAMWYSGYSPYGVIRYFINRYRVNRGRETFWKQSFGTRTQERQRLRDGVVGSFAMALGLFLRSNSGDDDPDKSEFKVIFTGKGPKDPATRQAWAKRFAPYSMNIKVGKAYFPFNMGRMGESVAWPFALSGALDDVALAKKGKLARNPGATFRDTPELLGSYFGSLTQRAAFQSIGRAFGSADSSQESAATTDKLFKQGMFTASAFVPWKGAMGSVTRLLSDPVETNTMSGVVLSNTPAVGALLGKPAINVLGDPLGDRSFAGRLYREGIPLVVRFPSTGSSSKAYDLILDQGRGPSLPQRAALERMYGPVDPEQFYLYSKKRGELIKAEMEKRYDKLRTLDPEQFAAAMEAISRSVNPRAAKAANLSR